ncbi:hypothetical protein Dm11a5_0153 [Dehalococcoides mccartyi]|uniref:DUF4145 domain-containing protein n=2 Tax=Dehalococcoides mccartyi TaxID=61435 RepID=A0A142V838_9CHLR|nr:hypothetical protein Dm11a5_0153 [Dehalococcoides mccartyi]
MAVLNFGEISDKLKRGDEISLKSRTQRYLELSRVCGEYRMIGFYPKIESPDGDDVTSQRFQALEQYIQSMWNDAFWSYIHGSFPACILLAASALEGALKYRLFEVIGDERAISKYLTLDKCIKRSMNENILPNDKKHRIVRAASRVQKMRDGLIHANRERWQPEIVLFGTPREHEVTGSPDMRFIREYKTGARMGLIHTGRVLGHLFPQSRPY